MINMFHLPNFEDMTMLQNGQKLGQFDKINLFTIYPYIVSAEFIFFLNFEIQR